MKSKLHVYTQLCVTKLLQIVKSKTAKFLCSKLSQKPAVSPSHNDVMHVSHMSMHVSHMSCMKHVSINACHVHVYIKIFLLDKFLFISWVGLHSWNQNYMLHTTVCY